MDALVPGSSSEQAALREFPRQDRAISIQGLAPGVAYELAECCHPVPGDRIVGLRGGQVVFDGPPAALTAEREAALYGFAAAGAPADRVPDSALAALA